jgi:thiosulfate/3-mercaptopyruvate sulfurtransferase
VEPEWLQANLDRPNLRIIDQRYGIESYWQNHVPNAVHLYPDVLTLTDSGVPSKPMPPEILVQILGRMGITESTMVVSYSEIVDSLSPYLTWALDYLGHERHALLKGEFDRWQAEGRPLTQAFPTIRAVKYRLPAKLNDGVRATLADVKAAVKDKKAVILDVRSPAMYLGTKGTTKRRGHIPGAINRPWLKDLKPDYTWRDSTELRKEYEQLGVTPDKNIIICCSKGYRSTHTYVTLKYVLGYRHVAVYDGGFSEWSSIDSLPVEMSQ